MPNLICLTRHQFDDDSCADRGYPDRVQFRTVPARLPRKMSAAASSPLLERTCR